MKVSLEWLKEYVAIRLRPEQLAERLTLAGLEVIGVERVGQDIVFDLEITPNRPDCLSVIGIAREIAAITGGRLRGLQTRDTRHETKAAGVSRLASRVSRLAIRVEDRRGCPRYIGRLIGDIRVGPSPAWMVRRLAAAGLRAVNNVVDITNYVLLETGQPLHAFDVDRLAEGRIVVRRAKRGERIVTLDGQTRELAAETLVIADARRPVAVAGVMGGQGTEVTAATRRVLLESAAFDPVLVRRASRRLALRTESSYRFERGVDWHGVAAASQRATALIAQVAGGRPIGPPVDRATTAPARRPAVELSLERVRRYAGVTIPAAMAAALLTRVGARCVRRGAARLDVVPPSWRRDLVIEADLMEEIIRLWGYDRIPAAMPSAPLAPAVIRDETWFERCRVLRAWLVAAGLDEAITYHLLSRQAHRLFAAEGEEPVTVVNPLSREQEVLRASLLPGLARAAAWNLNHGVESVRLFELGSAYPSVTTSSSRLAVALAGAQQISWRTGRTKPDLFDLKGLVEWLSQRAGGGAIRCEPARRAGFADGAACEIRLGGRAIGVLGRCSDEVLAQLDVRQPIALLEVESQPLMAAPAR